MSHLARLIAAAAFLALSTTALAIVINGSTPN